VVAVLVALDVHWAIAKLATALAGGPPLCRLLPLMQATNSRAIAASCAPRHRRWLVLSHR
jgi:hypothetical protein